MTDFPAIRTNDDLASVDEAIAWARAAAPDLAAETEAAGALLLRGFPFASPEDFDALIAATGWPGFTYAESLSNAVRVNVTPRVFTANEAPPEVAIDLHHEMAQTPIYPAKLLFFCEIAAEAGGATPVCRSDLLWNWIAAERPGFARDCEAKGVRYTNVMPGDDDAASGQGRSWKSTLGVDDAAGAEARLGALGYEHEWLADGRLRVTTAVMPAVRLLADGSKSFFNQLIAAWKGWADTPEGQPAKIMFGDGSPIADADMAAVAAKAADFTHDLAWRPGDVAILDNYRVMHGRRPFEGRRRVLAALVN